MATVQLADIYNPLVFNQAVQESAIELNAFLASGVAVQDPLVSALASGPGNIEIDFAFSSTSPTEGRVLLMVTRVGGCTYVTCTGKRDFSVPCTKGLFRRSCHIYQGYEALRRSASKCTLLL